MSASANRELYEGLFRKADKDGSGCVSEDELVGMIMEAQPDQSEEELRGYFKSCDTSGNGQLTEAEFLSAMGVTPLDKAEVMRGVFNRFDTDGSGCISQEELDKVFEEMKKDFTECQLKRMMAMMDTSGDGKVDYEEFISRFFC